MIAKRSKYGNVKTEIDGILFDSKREAQRYLDLKLLHQCGHIQIKRIHPEYPIVINGVKVWKYEGDFEYLEIPTGKVVCEDSKGYRTDVYKLKIKAARAYYAGTIEFREV